MRTGFIELHDFCLEFFPSTSSLTFLEESCGFGDIVASCGLFSVFYVLVSHVLTCLRVIRYGWAKQKDCRGNGENRKGTPSILVPNLLFLFQILIFTCLFKDVHRARNDSPSKGSGKRQNWILQLILRDRFRPTRQLV